MRLCRLRVQTFVRCITTFALLQLFGGNQARSRPRCAGTDPPSYLPRPIAMFRIVLQPEEVALLCAIRDGLCPADEVPGSVLLSLMALRMLKCDEHGNPTLTDLAEAALERMSNKLH